MKNNTKVRLHLSKKLFESLTKEIIKEAKANDGYTVAVKQPKQVKEVNAVADTNKMKKIKEIEMNVAEEGQLDEFMGDPSISWESIAAGMAAIGLAPLAIDKLHKWWEKKHPESFKKAQGISRAMDRQAGNKSGQGHGVDQSNTFGPKESKAQKLSPEVEETDGMKKEAAPTPTGNSASKLGADMIKKGQAVKSTSGLSGQEIKNIQAILDLIVNKAPEGETALALQKALTILTQNTKNIEDKGQPGSTTSLSAMNAAGHGDKPAIPGLKEKKVKEMETMTAEDSNVSEVKSADKIKMNDIYFFTQGTDKYGQSGKAAPIKVRVLSAYNDEWFNVEVQEANSDHKRGDKIKASYVNLFPLTTHFSGSNEPIDEVRSSKRGDRLQEVKSKRKK